MQTGLRCFGIAACELMMLGYMCYERRSGTLQVPIWAVAQRRPDTEGLALAERHDPRAAVAEADDEPAFVPRRAGSEGSPAEVGREDLRSGVGALGREEAGVGSADAFVMVLDE